MAHIDYSERELETRGCYTHRGTWYGADYPKIEKLSPPISPAENLRRYMIGGDYEWIPDLNSDQVDITPSCNPDVNASDYTGGYDAFGVKWIPVPDKNANLPAFVEPGFKILEDIADWRNLKWPDPDTWGLSESGQKYRDFYKDDDRMLRGVILSGFFERLIANMTFEEAAVAMISDPESVKEFFSKLADFNIQILDHYIDDYGCQSIKLHDDWSAQKAPFFSPATAEELLVPYLKRVVDHAHERGIIFTHHSCGNGVMLLPVIKESGAEAWNAQCSAFHDLDDVLASAGNDIKLEISMTLPIGLHGSELEKAIYDIMNRYADHHNCLIKFDDPDPDRVLESRKLIYKVGRILALEGK